MKLRTAIIIQSIGVILILSPLASKYGEKSLILGLPTSLFLWLFIFIILIGFNWKFFSEVKK
jgi:hypothetical protein